MFVYYPKCVTHLPRALPAKRSFSIPQHKDYTVFPNKESNLRFPISTLGFFSFSCYNKPTKEAEVMRNVSNTGSG